jgi:hypothetical protein
MQLFELHFQLLAALLITRQVMGNIKEALIPYVKQQLRFAKISFDLYGAISPTNPDKNDESISRSFEQEDSSSNLAETNNSASKEEPEITGRKLSQVEMESSRPAVRFFLHEIKTRTVFYQKLKQSLLKPVLRLKVAKGSQS